MMRQRVRQLAGKIRRDPVLAIAGILALLSMLLVPPDSKYLGYLDFKVLICLLALMLAVELFQNARLFTAIAAGILNRVGGLRRLTAVLTGLTFLASMLLTNDVALITLVPLSLIVFRILDDTGALIRVVVLQTLAANAGSCLTPIGNPQNLFLYAHFQMEPRAFLLAVLPVVLTGIILLGVLILLLPDRSLNASVQPAAMRKGTDLLLACLLFPAAVGCVLGFWSEWILLGLVLALLLPRRASVLLRADYSLLLTFVFFFIFIGNISRLPAVRETFQLMLNGPQRVLLAGSLLSQVISNVPAAILLAGFTEQAGQLLRGVDIGGFGTLIASLASVISFKLYCRDADPGRPEGKRQYMAVFTGYNLLFLLAMLLAGMFFPY